MVVVVAAAVLVRRRSSVAEAPADSPTTTRVADEPMTGLEAALAEVTDREGRPIGERIDAEAEIVDGLRVPDDTLAPDSETGHYRHGEIDWQEFVNVIAGNGPCNRERLAKRTMAHEDGGWVREAARAYAEKQASRAAA